MDNINWVQIGIALISGGTMGAIITAIITAIKGRQQPVGKRIEVLPVFSPTSDSGKIEAAIAIKYDKETASFDNLFLINLNIVNKGNKDIEFFEFGATLSDGDKCIYVEHTAPDRHHVISMKSPVTPLLPQSEIDIQLRPFNRGDSYFFKFYIVIPESKKVPNELSLSSPCPIKFTTIPSAGEIFSNVMLTLGPFPIGFVENPFKTAGK